MGDPLQPTDPSRRAFLAGAAAVVAGLAVGCGDDGGTDGSAGATTTGPSTTGGTPTTTNVADLGGDPFTLGVASGDPREDSVVLWTRLAPEPLAADGLGGMPDQPVDLIWEVATDDTFATVLATGAVTAEPAHAHAVHVVVDGLEPGADLAYRFTVGDVTSPVGRTRTLPAGSPERFALAVVNCQWRETGGWAAFTHLLDEDVDLVLHLGDYIYEFPGIAGPRVTAPDHALVSLADYRLRYASYKQDPALAAAHQRFPFSLTWDDHEVANNYMGDQLEDGSSAEVGRERKAAAYQAWWEHQPVRLDPPDGPDLVVAHAFAVGDLARIVVLDERQDADVPPCRGTATAADDFGDCPDRTAVDRTRLGSDQEAMVDRAVSDGGVRWNLIGNPVVLAGVDGGNDTDGSKFYLDTWDGFPDARLRLIEQLASMTNPVVLTGDYHAGMVLDVHERPFDQSSAVVAPEFMAPPISSPLFAADVGARTPQLRQQLNGHGYLTVEVTPDLLTARFQVLDDVQDPASAIQTVATWQVRAGSPTAEPA
jgi:alkaline phosphatase D